MPHCLLDNEREVIIDDFDLPTLLDRIYTLRLRTEHRDLYLRPILMACSTLDNLHISGDSDDKLFICWGKDTASDTEAWNHSRLAHFTIEYVSISHDTMEALLSVCPHLTYLKAWRDRFFRGQGSTALHSGITVGGHFLSSRYIN